MTMTTNPEGFRPRSRNDLLNLSMESAAEPVSAETTNTVVVVDTNGAAVAEIAPGSIDVRADTERLRLIADTLNSIKNAGAPATVAMESLAIAARSITGDYSITTEGFTDSAFWKGLMAIINKVIEYAARVGAFILNGLRRWMEISKVDRAGAVQRVATLTKALNEAKRGPAGGLVPFHLEGECVNYLTLNEGRLVNHVEVQRGYRTFVEKVHKPFASWLSQHGGIVEEIGKTMAVVLNVKDITALTTATFDPILALKLPGNPTGWTTIGTEAQLNCALFGGIGGVMYRVLDTAGSPVMDLRGGDALPMEIPKSIEALDVTPEALLEYSKAAIGYADLTLEITKVWGVVMPTIQLIMRGYNKRFALPTGDVDPTFMQDIALHNGYINSIVGYISYLTGTMSQYMQVLTRTRSAVEACVDGVVAGLKAKP